MKVWELLEILKRHDADDLVVVRTHNVGEPERVKGAKSVRVGTWSNPRAVRAVELEVS